MNKKDREADLSAVAAEEKASELAILKESLDQAKAQAADYYDQLLRLKADFENFRKRSDREKADARRFGKEELLLRLIAMMDVVEQAEKAAHASPDLKSVITGLDLLYGEFKRLLKEEDVQEISGEGEKFDPAQQEAVETVEHEGAEGQVLSVIQKGYRSKSGMLRPARVRVSQRKPSAKDDEEKKETGRFNSEGGARYEPREQ